MRVLHAPLDLAGVGSSNVSGLRQLGVEADLATIWNSPLVPPGDIDLSFWKDGIVKRQYKKWRFCQNNLPTYDVIHYHFGRSILDYGNSIFMLLDMKRAYNLGIPLFATFHGCEVRKLTPGGCKCLCGYRDQCTSEISSQRRRIALVRTMICKSYVTTPDLLSAVSDAMLLPQSVEGLEKVALVPPRTSGTMVIAHAPSHRARKGTEDIISACEDLQREGLDIELLLIEGVEHKLVPEIMARADIVIDQVMSPAIWYGVTSVEAAALGKVVAVSMDESLMQIFGGEAPPFTSVRVDNLRDKLRWLYEHRELLPQMGRDNRAFVLRRHGALAHAKLLLEDYRCALDASL